MNRDYINDNMDKILLVHDIINVGIFQIHASVSRYCLAKTKTLHLPHCYCDRQNLMLYRQLIASSYEFMPLQLQSHIVMISHYIVVLIACDVEKYFLVV